MAQGMVRPCLGLGSPPVICLFEQTALLLQEATLSHSLAVGSRRGVNKNVR